MFIPVNSPIDVHRRVHVITAAYCLKDGSWIYARQVMETPRVTVVKARISEVHHSLTKSPTHDNQLVQSNQVKHALG